MPIHYNIWGASAAQATAFATHENIIYGKTMREQHVGTIYENFHVEAGAGKQQSPTNERTFSQNF